MFSSKLPHFHRLVTGSTGAHVYGREHTPSITVHSPVTPVLGVGKQCLVIGAEVEADGEAVARVDARRRGVQRDLALADAHAVGPEVAEAEDAFAIRHDDDAYVALGQRPQLLQHAAAVGQADVQPVRGERQLVVPLARLPN